MTIRIAAINVSENGRERYLFTLHASVLKQMLEQNFQIVAPEYNFKKSTGFQRITKNKQKRVKEISTYVENGNSFDSAAHLNISPNHPLVIEKMPTYPIVFINFEPNVPIEITDANHRIEGLKSAIDAASIKGKMLDTNMPCILTRYIELQNKKEFVVKNSTAEKMSKNLFIWEKRDLKRDMSKEEWNSLPASVKKGTSNIIEACAVVEKLSLIKKGNLQGNILVGKIEMPNESIAHKIIDCNQLATHVQRSFSNKKKSFPKSPEDVATIWSNWFQAWNEIVPEAVNNMELYGLFRPHVGSEVVCALLNMVMTLKETKNKVPTVKTFIDIIEKTGKFGKEAFWNSSNPKGFAPHEADETITIKPHGLDNALKLAKAMFAEITAKVAVGD